MSAEDSGGFDDELIEIERASAILHQRDPSQAAQVVSALRAREAEARRREEAAQKIREAAAKRRRVRRMRLAIVAGALALVGLAAIPLTRAVLNEAKRADALRAALDKAGEPVSRLGFGTGEEWLDVPPAGMVFEVPRNTCSVVIGIAEGGTDLLPLRVSREGIDPIEFGGGIIWCSCEKEQASVVFRDSSDKRLALRYLTAKMGSVGGIEVLNGLKKPGYLVAPDEQAFGCADAAFSAWAQTGGHGALDVLDEASERHIDAFRRENFVPLGRLSASKRFAVVPSQPNRCYLALPFGKKAPITLRNTAGRRLVQDSFRAMGWCSYKRDRAYSLWRKELGDPEVIVLEVPAQRVGGLTGLREAALRNGAKRLETVIENEDLAPDATASLLASGIVETTIIPGTETGLPGNANSQVVAFGLHDTSSFLPDVAPRVPLACDPELIPAAPFQTYVCVQARPQQWRREGAVDTQGAAEGRLPFWATMLADTNDPEALAAVARMLAFARRMTLLGFEPTTTDGVKDSPFGGEVLGRPEKSEAIAVGLAKRPPWIHPLTDGGAWTLDGELPISKVRLGESIKVRTRSGTLGPDPNSRRVVVWRK